MGRINEGKSPDIMALNHRHRSMARAVVAGGLTPGDLCKIYGMSNGQISRILGSPAFECEVERLEVGASLIAQDLRAEVMELRDKAIYNLKDDLDLLVDGSPKNREIRQKASLVALEMGGLRKSGGVTLKGGITLNQQNVTNLSVEQLSKDVFDILEDSEDE